MRRPLATRLVVDPTRPPPRKIAHAVETLRSGGVIAYPTDTVYGIGCPLGNRRGIERIYRLKGMDQRQLLAFLCPGLSGISRYAVVTDFAYRVMRRIFPGPYTVVLEATREVPRVLVQKRRTIGIRVPDCGFCQALVAGVGEPLVSTSAASPDGEALHDPDDILRVLGHGLELVVDGGLLEHVPSTVVSLVGDVIDVLRAGKGPVEGVLL